MSCGPAVNVLWSVSAVCILWSGCACPVICNLWSGEATLLCMSCRLIVPVFGMGGGGDGRAMGILRDLHPEYGVESVECRELATEGGLLSCVTWQVMMGD